MAQGFASQLGLLLWKNWLLQKRRICISVFEVLLPIFFAVMMLLIRSVINQDDVSSITTYPYTSSTTSRSNFPTAAIIGYAPSNPATDQVMSTAFSLFESYTPATGSGEFFLCVFFLCAYPLYEDKYLFEMCDSFGNGNSN